MFGEAEIDVGEVDEDGEGGRVALDGGDEAVVARVDAGRVAEDLGDAHVGDVLGADDALLACRFHLRAAEAGEACGGQAGAQGGDDLRAVVIAGGLPGGEEDARIGRGGDADKCIVCVRAGGACGGEEECKDEGVEGG